MTNNIYEPDTGEKLFAGQSAKVFNLMSWSNPLNKRFLILSNVDIIRYSEDYTKNNRLIIYFYPVIHILSKIYPDATFCSPSQQVACEKAAIELSLTTNYNNFPLRVSIPLELNSYDILQSSRGNTNTFMPYINIIKQNWEDILLKIKDAVFDAVFKDSGYLWVEELKKHKLLDHQAFIEYKLERLGF